jgi:general secretion pathway protein H
MLHHVRKRARARGITLIEMLVVLALIALFAAVVIAGSGQLSGARLRKGAAMLNAAIRVAFIRATVMSRSVRLVMDFEKNAIWLEEADQPMLVGSHDPTGGAEAVTAAEKAALAESERIIKGPGQARPAFHAVGMGLVPSTEEKDRKDRNEYNLPSGIKFREVQSTHDDEPRTSDRAYLYFWPGGMTERASIVIKAGDENDDAKSMTVVVSPLTGSTQIMSGAVALKVPADDKEASERVDRGP